MEAVDGYDEALGVRASVKRTERVPRAAMAGATFGSVARSGRRESTTMTRMFGLSGSGFARKPRLSRGARIRIRATRNTLDAVIHAARRPPREAPRHHPASAAAVTRRKKSPAAPATI